MPVHPSCTASAEAAKQPDHPEKYFGFATRAIHSGCHPDEVTGAVSAPIFMTSTYAQEYPGKDKGYDYTRAGNPGFTRLETQLASLEGAKYCTAVASGLAAISSVLGDLVAGDAVVFLNSLYGGTYRLLKKVFEPKRILLKEILVRDLPQLREVFRTTPNVKFIMFESPTNPLMEIVDIAHVCRIAREFNVRTIADNTFATPFHQNPLALGADVVVHSCTKYIGGHSDVLGGAVLTNDPAIYEAVCFQRKCVGYNPSPFDAWLLSRSLKTLPVRMERHAANAQELAEFLHDHPMVSAVYYPGLPSHPNHAVAVKQMQKGFSGVVSVEFALSLDAMKRLISSFKVFTLAESLGGVESLVNHPASMTHASLPPEERQKIGLSDGLVRFSVGLEAIEDLIQDIRQALDVVTA